METFLKASATIENLKTSVKDAAKGKFYTIAQSIQRTNRWEKSVCGRCLMILLIACTSSEALLAQTWNLSAPSIDVVKFFSDPANGKLYGVGHNDIYLASDTGWRTIYHGTVVEAAAILNDTLFTFVCTSGKGMDMSPNGGATWVQRSNGLPNNIFSYDMVTCGGHFFLATTDSGLYSSANYGATWEHTYPSPNTIFSICTAGNRVIIGLAYKIAYSDDYGNTYMD